MPFKVIEPGIEVFGASVGAMIDAFRRYPSVAMKCLAKNGLLKAQAGKQAELDRTAWYPIESWLAAFDGIANEVGFNSLYTLGKSIPANAVFPPQVTDIQSALASLDVAYHLNHRKNGEVMFNLETGKMLEGIGHYEHRASGGHESICVCENPFPCEFDHGIIAAMANRFEPLAITTHDEDAPCRKKGANSCTYVVSW